MVSEVDSFDQSGFALGCPYGSVGFSNDENSTSNVEVSVIYFGVDQTLYCGAFPSDENILVEAQSAASPSGIPSDHPSGIGSVYEPPVGVDGIKLSRLNTILLYEVLGLNPGCPSTPLVPLILTGSDHGVSDDITPLSVISFLPINIF